VREVLALLDTGGARVSSGRVPIEVLWCGNARTKKSNGWSFPPAVNNHLRQFTDGKRVGHFFGGRSKWGVRLDIDPVTKPHVRGDAWLPPFCRNAFDVVILDPPYIRVNQQMKTQLLRQASFAAAEHVIWFHTMWIAADSKLRLKRAWLVRVGDSCACRCIQVFRTPAVKAVPVPKFTRGPALRYNRWLDGQMGMRFEAEAIADA
jgi:hypothetical protein